MTEVALPESISCSDGLPDALLRAVPEDFVVVEIPAYTPSGAGDHLFVTFRKRGLTTLRAVEQLAHSLGADPREAGFAGMKDRHAVTTQTASFFVPPGSEPERALAAAAIDGVEILGLARHGHKLRTGHLRANRFELTLRELAPGAAERIGQALERVRAEGVPNAYGEQRFGRDGDNATRARAWLEGTGKRPRGSKEQRLLVSALQSAVFNRVLGERERLGTWTDIEPGDLAQKHDTGGLFPVDEAALADARDRAARGLVSATGPMPGPKMRWPEGRPAEIERAALAAIVGDEQRLAAFGRLGRGARRALRLWVDELCWQADPGGERLGVSFVLASGGYATTVLARVCRPREPVRASGPIRC